MTDRADPRAVRCELTRLTAQTEHLDDVLAELGAYASTGGAPRPGTVTVYVERDQPNAVWLHETREVVTTDESRPEPAFGTFDVARMLDETPHEHALRPVRETHPGRNLAGPVHASSVVILAELTARPGLRDQVLTALEPFMRVADDEPGTEIFTVYESRREPDVIWMHEVYTDDAAYCVHVANPLHKTLRDSGVLTGGPSLSSVLAAAPRNWRLVPQLQRRHGELVRWIGGSD